MRHQQEDYHVNHKTRITRALHHGLKHFLQESGAAWE
jgi:hypothetical protein